MKKPISKILTFSLAGAMLATSALAGDLGHFKPALTYQEGQFVDVQSGDWFSENVRSAYELRLMKGTEAERFQPSENLTLGSAIALAARLRSIYDDGFESRFNQHDGKNWYDTYVAYAQKMGMLEGLDTDDYESTATRWQFAVLLTAALPAEEFKAINTVEDGSIVGVEDGVSYEEAVYTLYRAGVAIGDQTGDFMPDGTLSRAESAILATRAADPTLRRDFSKEETEKPDEKPDETPDEEEATPVQQVLALVNAARAEAGAEALELDEKMTAAAQVRATELAKSFTHDRPDGSKPFTALDEAGVTYQSAGENIASGQTTAEEAMKSWMGSEGHKENILNGHFGRMGVGYFQAENGQHYWVQLFCD